MYWPGTKHKTKHVFLYTFIDFTNFWVLYLARNQNQYLKISCISVDTQEILWIHDVLRCVQ